MDGSGNEENESTKKWWEYDTGLDTEDTKRVAVSIFDELDRIDRENMHRHTINLQSFMLYMSCDLINRNPYNLNFRPSQEPIAINIVQQTIDALRAKITHNKIKPTYLTDNADWEKQEKAKKLDAFILGQFYRSDVYKESSVSFLNGCIYGTGAMKIYPDFEKMNVCVEDINPMELRVCEKEAYYGRPLSWYHVRQIDKAILLEQFPEYEMAIRKATVHRGNFWISDVTESNNVTVIESWRVAIGKKVGRHAIAIEGCTLEFNEWKERKPPFVFFKYQEVGFNFYGRGIAELLSPVQLMINHVVDRIQRSINLVASPKVLYEYGSKIIKSHFNNEVGAMVGYKGTPPQFVMPQAVGQELFTWLEWLISRGFQEIGLSEMSSGSQAPQNLSSGEALRTYNDIETVRFATIANKWEKFHLEIAEACIDCIKALSKSKKDYSVLAKMNDGVLDIKWNEVDLQKEAYIIQSYPTSLLPKEPSGRLATVIDLMNSGLIQPDVAINLLDFPDIEGEMRYMSSARNDIKMVIQGFLKGQYEPPSPLQDLQNGIKLMQTAYLYFKGKKLTDDKLNLFTQWIDQALTLMTPQEMLPAMTDGMEGQDPMSGGQNMAIGQDQSMGF